MASATADFGIDVFARYKDISLDPTNPTLTAEQKADLLSNISLLRDTIVYFTGQYFAPLAPLFSECLRIRILRIYVSGSVPLDQCLRTGA